MLVFTEQHLNTSQRNSVQPSSQTKERKEITYQSYSLLVHLVWCFSFKERGAVTNLIKMCLRVGSSGASLNRSCQNVWLEPLCSVSFMWACLYFSTLHVFLPQMQSTSKQPLCCFCFTKTDCGGSLALTVCKLQQTRQTGWKERSRQQRLLARRGRGFVGTFACASTHCWRKETEESHNR